MSFSLVLDVEGMLPFPGIADASRQLAPENVAWKTMCIAPKEVLKKSTHSKTAFRSRVEEFKMQSFRSGLKT